MAIKIFFNIILLLFIINNSIIFCQVSDELATEPQCCLNPKSVTNTTSQA